MSPKPSKSLFHVLSIWFVGIVMLVLSLTAFVAISSMEETVGHVNKVASEALLARSAEKISTEIDRFTKDAQTLAASDALVHLRESPLFAKNAWLDEVKVKFKAYLSHLPETIYLRHRSENDRSQNVLASRSDQDSNLYALMLQADDLFAEQTATQPARLDQPLSLITRLENNEGKPGILHLIVPVKDPITKATVSHLQLGINMSYLDQMISYIKPSKDEAKSWEQTSVLLIDGDTKFISGYGPLIDLIQNNDDALKQSIAQIIGLEGSGTNRLESELLPPAIPFVFGIKALDWRLIMVVPDSVIYQDVYRLRNTLIIIIGFFSLFAMFLVLIASKHITKPIEELVQGAQSVSTGNLDLRLKVRGFRELETLGKHFNNMSENLKVNIEEGLRASERKALLEKELETAAILQTRFFPSTQLINDLVELEAYNTAASAVGGDWFSYYLCDDWLHVHLGDVTGHGTAAALLAAFAKGATDMVYEDALRAGGRLPQLHHLHTNLNRVLALHKNDQAFMTMASVAVNLSTGALQYINSGHPPTFVVNSRTGKCTPLSGQGRSLIGFLADRQSKPATTIQLEPDDMLLLYSDGLLDAYSLLGARHNIRTFSKELLEISDKSAKDVKQYLVELAHRNEEEILQDDVTFIVIKPSITSYQKRKIS